MKEDNTNETLYDYTTVVGPQEASAPANDGLAPFGITYAVFGSNRSSNFNQAATYSFKDGKYKIKKKKHL